jgi:4-amino-4-deoxy-L-arabinose transferase-like glycosyltransferase
MQTRLSRIYHLKWVQIAFLIGFCFVLYFLNLGRWDLWNPDEPRYAEVAREMVGGGDWILMHYNGKIYGDKPPLFFWLIAFSSYLWQGFTPFAARFPSALFGTLTILLTFFLGKHLYSSRTGFLSALILATSFEFAFLSTRANIDTTLTFFTTASLFSFFYWLLNRSPHPLDSAQGRPSPLPQGERKGVRGNLAIYGFYIGMGFATLAKGPVGFILPFLVSFAYLIFRKDWKGIRAVRLLPGMFLFLAIVLAWYLPAVWKGGRDYLDATLLRHSVGRFVRGMIHIKPIYFYLYVFPADFLPWIFFLPSAIVYGFSRGMAKKRKEFLFLLIWFAVIFLFFSVPKGKRDLYLLPLFPGVSLMVGKLWDDYISTSIKYFRSEWISFPIFGLMILVAVAGGTIPWVFSIKFTYPLPYSLPISFLMVGGSLTIFALYRFKNYGAIVFLIIGMVAGGFFYTLRIVFPLANSYKSARFISQEITSQIKDGEKLATYGFETGPYNYYTKIVPILELNEEEGLSHFLRSPERVFCLIRSRDLEEIKMKDGLPIVELAARHHPGHMDIVLISNR